VSLPPSELEKVDCVVEILKTCNDILFITGAGISADSGLPTYRGVGGLYNETDAESGMPIEVALSGQIMESLPNVTWRHLYDMEERCRSAVPNRGHQVIAEMEKHFDRVWILTQNIDGLHHKAGSKNVIDIHGYIYDLACTECDYRTTVENYAGLEVPPLCPKCNAIVRPDVVLFGELLPAEKLRILSYELERGFDIIFSVGTTSFFYYISQPVLSARMHGSKTVEINPGTSEVSNVVDIKISAGSAETLAAIWERYRKQTGEIGKNKK